MNSRNGRQRLRSPHLIVALVFLLAPVKSADAQYMYLDSNGDGLHTDADVVSPKDTTRIALWLDTGHNRDGTTVACKPGESAILSRYDAVLESTDGTVRWDTFVPDASAHWENFNSEPADSLHYVVVYMASPGLPSGKHRLGTVNLTVRHGTPSIQIAQTCPVHPQHYTEFSFSCAGTELNLGGAWNDVDGLSYGGRANSPPVLSLRSEFRVRAGSTSTYRIRADDSDGDPVTFRKVDGPSGSPTVSVRTVDPGHGHAVGELVFAADSCADGTGIFVIEASDGIWGDRRTTEAPVKRIDRPVPVNPMGPARESNAPMSPLRVHPRDASVDPNWIVGDWEWDGSPRSGGISPERFRTVLRPVAAGHRRRLVIRKDGSFELYELGPGRVRLAAKGTYALEAGSGNPDPEGRIRFSSWIESGGDYSIWKSGPDTFGLYPWRASDAAADYYVRVAQVRKGGALRDTSSLLEPIGTPKIRKGPKGFDLTLPASMTAALRRYDGAFRPFTARDFPGPDFATYACSESQVPWALIGDFDGDLLQDVALYGRSGDDEVVVALLSRHGNVGALEVARRTVAKVERGVLKIFLELAPRGAEYSPCWARNGTPEADAIGIVSPGVARFDYALLEGEFVVFAPVP